MSFAVGFVAVVALKSMDLIKMRVVNMKMVILDRHKIHCMMSFEVEVVVASN